MIQTQNRRPNCRSEKLHLKTQMKIVAYPGLAQSGFEQPSPGALLLGLTKSIIMLYAVNIRDTLMIEINTFKYCISCFQVCGHSICRK